MINYYVLLGVEFDCDANSIQFAYDRVLSRNAILSKKAKGLSQEKLQEFATGKDILLDASRRRLYDAKLYEEQCRILGALPSMHLTAIEKSYKGKALELHPDKGGDNAQFHLLDPALKLVQHYKKKYGEVAVEEEKEEPEEEDYAEEVKALFENVPQYTQLLSSIKSNKNALPFSDEEYQNKYQKLRNNLIAKKIPLISYTTKSKSIMFQHFAEALRNNLTIKLELPYVKKALKSPNLEKALKSATALPLHSVENIAELIRVNIELFNYLKKKITEEHSASVEYLKRNEPDKPLIEIIDWKTYAQAYEQISELKSTLLAQRNRFSVQTFLEDNAALKERVKAESSDTNAVVLIATDEALLNYLKDKIGSIVDYYNKNYPNNFSLALEVTSWETYHQAYKQIYAFYRDLHQKYFKQEPYKSNAEFSTQNRAFIDQVGNVGFEKIKALTDGAKKIEKTRIHAELKSIKEDWNIIFTEEFPPEPENLDELPAFKENVNKKVFDTLKAKIKEISCSLQLSVIPNLSSFSYAESFQYYLILCIKKIYSELNNPSNTNVDTFIQTNRGILQSHNKEALLAFRNQLLQHKEDLNYLLRCDWLANIKRWASLSLQDLIAGAISLRKKQTADLIASAKNALNNIPNTEHIKKYLKTYLDIIENFSGNLRERHELYCRIQLEIPYINKIIEYYPHLSIGERRETFQEFSVQKIIQLTIEKQTIGDDSEQTSEALEQKRVALEEKIRLFQENSIHKLRELSTKAEKIDQLKASVAVLILPIKNKKSSVNNALLKEKLKTYLNRIEQFSSNVLKEWQDLHTRVEIEIPHIVKIIKHSVNLQSAEIESFDRYSTQEFESLANTVSARRGLLSNSIWRTPSLPAPSLKTQNPQEEQTNIINLRRRLNTYIEKFDDYKTSDHNINFESGFDFLKLSRGINREINYITAQQLLEKLKNNNPNINDIFSPQSIEMIRSSNEEIKSCQKRKGYVDRGINGELDSIIKEVRANFKVDNCFSKLFK